MTVEEAAQFVMQENLRKIEEFYRLEVSSFEFLRQGRKIL